LPPYGNPRDRFGFDSGSLTGYDVAQLHAGWYSNWGASLNPAHPDGLVYVQLIRFHAGADPHDPAQVTVGPPRETIAQIAAAHPGSLWFMSNEPDSLYQGDPIYPDVYASVYHDFYTFIKGLDPTALIANGGIVQPTPCRLAYLDIVLDTYQTLYGEPMPVDVWNIHAFTLREVYGSWGASTPPGVDPDCGIDYAVDEADDVAIFWGNIQAMRAWMKEKGYQDRPLIISEYGILWPEWFAPQFTPARVSHFMTQTFDLFLYETDPEIGYPADANRLVQAWAWYSLSDDQVYNGYLFYSHSQALSPMGATYRDYTAALSDALYADLSARLVAAWPSLTPPLTDTGEALTYTVSLTGGIGNLGKLPVTDTLARLEILTRPDNALLWEQDTRYTVPARFEGVIALSSLTVTLTAPGRHDLRLNLDPDGQTSEPRQWNNVVTATLDVRPDLALNSLDYYLWTAPSELAWLSSELVLTGVVQNLGTWPGLPVSATVSVETWPQATPVHTDTLALTALPVGAQTTLSAYLADLPVGHDFYRVTMIVDPDEKLEEQSESNNLQEQLVPVGIGVTLTPTATTVLSSANGAVTLYFVAGVVTTPTLVRYTPLWPADWDAGLLMPSSLGFSLTALLNGQPTSLTFARPVTLTWQYGETDVAGLDEGALRLFALSGGAWQDAACRSYRRDPVGDELTAFICSTGTFVVGVRYDLHIPLYLSGNSAQQLSSEPMLSPVDEGRRSLLRLP
jgi:hypothetical protein